MSRIGKYYIDKYGSIIECVKEGTNKFGKKWTECRDVGVLLGKESDCYVSLEWLLNEYIEISKLEAMCLR